MSSLFRYWREIVAIASLLVGIYGIWGMRTAKAAARLARRKLLQIMAAKHFDELVRTSNLLTGSVRSGDWSRSGELAVGVATSLSEASGAWHGLLSGPDQDKVDVAIRFARSLTMSLSVGERLGEQQRILRLVEASEFIGSIAAEVAGRLKYAFQSEEE
jgi:hypothetical protein